MASSSTHPRAERRSNLASRREGRAPRDRARAQGAALRLLDGAGPELDYRIEVIGEKATSSIVLAYTSNQWMATVDILGSEGALFLDLQSQSIVKHNRTSLSPLRIGLSQLGRGYKQLWATCANSVRYATGRIRSTHELLIDGFVDSIIANRPPPVSAEEGREAVRVMNMIVEELGVAAAKQMTPA